MIQEEGLRPHKGKILKKRGSSPIFTEEKDEALYLKWPRVISVSSGKGGVGKTNIVANLAFAFTQMQKRVLVLDADLGLANINILLGLVPRYTIEHLLLREKSVSDILIKGPGGMSIIPASSGVLELTYLNESQKIFLLNELDLLAESVDILLINTAAGISANVLYFNQAAKESILIATPELTSITNTLALIKVLSAKHKKKKFTILINFVRNGKEAQKVYKKISMVVDRFLGSLSLDYLGFIPFDENLPKAVKQQRAVLELYPQAISSRSFMEVARTLAEKSPGAGSNGNVQFFWKHLLQNHTISHQRKPGGLIESESYPA
ncbi:MAG: MinD/ParA family protein [Deltaproteobacteria bacterium]|nr:MinD/ParA family protein [Deltaproteobacteria bacterium]